MGRGDTHECPLHDDLEHVPNWTLCPPTRLPTATKPLGGTRHGDMDVSGADAVPTGQAAVSRRRQTSNTHADKDHTLKGRGRERALSCVIFF